MTADLLTPTVANRRSRLLMVAITIVGIAGFLLPFWLPADASGQPRSAEVADRVIVLGDGEIVAEGPARSVLSGSLFAPQVLRVMPPLLTVAEVRTAVQPQQVER